MARRDLSRFDASEYEQATLDHILQAEKRGHDTTKYLSVEEALAEDSLFEVSSDRDVTRVLFISQDESLLNPIKQSLDGYTNLTELFDEVHVLILRQGIEAKNPVIRITKNLWLYTATNKNWWGTIKPGIDTAERQLAFAEGFRPDIIIARDPFESALVGRVLSKKYGRPLQIHVLEDYNSPEFLTKNRHNRWRRYMSIFTLRNVSSVRTGTRALYEQLQKKFTIKDLAVLPKFNNYESLIKQKAVFDAHDKYKPFVFIILYIGKLTHKSAAYRALDAARFGLKNPHIGLIFLGDGEAKKEIAERAKILGVTEQVVFVSDVSDEVSYLKSADVLLVTDETGESEEVVMRGAAAEIPMVLAKTPTRSDIFTDGESALFCDALATDQFSLKLNSLMNDANLRRHIAESAKDIIRTRFHEDPAAYRRAYRESIEQVLFLDGEEEVTNPEE